MVYQEIKILHDQGKLKELISLGIIPVKVLTQFEIYKYYLDQLEENRKSRICVTRAMESTADKFGVVEMTVYRAIKFCQRTR